MTNPRHTNPAQPGRRAHAPYNFVPLPEKVVTVEASELAGHDIYTGYTGYIDCELTTLSPLYTRAAPNPQFFEQWADKTREMMKDDKAREEYAQFFHLDDTERPVIPGSSLRGMVRSLVEIVGYGKMQWVTSEQLVFRAVADQTSQGTYYRQRLMRDDGKKKVLKGQRTKWVQHFTPLMQAGYLEQQRGQWFIRPAQTIGGTTFARIDQIPAGLSNWKQCQNAYHIWVKLSKYDYQDVKGGFLRIKYTPVLEAYRSVSASENLQEGVLCYSGPMDKKQREVVIFPADNSANAKLIQVDDALVRAYLDQLTQGQKDLLGEKGIFSSQHQPIFYLMEKGKLVFFGHTMLFRMPYEHSPLDFVPTRLRQENDIDLAEAIFGLAPQSKTDKRGARAGRVFFVDAQLQTASDGIWLCDTPITAQILGSPKPTTFQHYLTQDEPDKVETGEFDKQDRPKTELRLKHYASGLDKTVIRGHKLYWHQRPSDFIESTEPDWQTDTQHTQIRPVKEGVSFRFRVYFENLHDFELGALLWVLILPGQAGQDYCHSLGMGKPLGMGAVKITPTLYLGDRKSRYAQLFAEKNWQRSEALAPDMQPFIQKFEAFILDRMDKTERGKAQSLKEIERIKMLLKMLEWLGPKDRRLTEYMVIEPTNEYKERPVLPDPLHIAEPTTSSGVSKTSKPQIQLPTQPSTLAPKGQSPMSPQPAATKPRQATPKTEPELSHPTSEEEIQEGMYLEGQVVRVESGRIVVDIGGIEATLSKDKVTPPIQDEYEWVERFPQGFKIKLWVSGRSKKSKIQLTMLRPSKT